MKTTPLINMHAVCMVVLAFFVSSALWYFKHDNEYFAVTQVHGQVGYNMYTYNSWNLNPKLTAYMASLPGAGTQLCDYDTACEKNFGQPVVPFPVNDTIGYGVLLGGLWKITNSLKFRDVQVLQIILFALSFFFVYQLGLMFFCSRALALTTCIALIAFLPLVAQVITPVRDVWAYFGTVMLLYGLMAFLYEQMHVVIFMACCLFFALCQWVRPAAFLAVIAAAIALIIWGIYEKKVKKCGIALVCMLWVNIAIFWVPFMAYNKSHYGRYIVGPGGQDLIEGLGEFKNPWGYALDDMWIADYVGKKYGVVYGTPEFDDAARKEFLQAFDKQPTLFWINMVRRIPMLCLPALPWLFYKKSPYQDFVGFKNKVRAAFSSWSLFLDFMLRVVYIRFFLLLGYIGMYIAVRERRYKMLLFCLALIVAGWGKLPSHIEYRYLVPFYWPFAFFVALAWNKFWRYTPAGHFLQKLLPRVRKGIWTYSNRCAIIILLFVLAP